MHNLESVLGNETNELFWDFKIQIDHLISAKQPDLIIINNNKKRIYKIVDFAVPADHGVKLKESEKKDKYLDLAKELKTVERASDGVTNCNWFSWYSYQRINKGTAGLGNNRTSGDHPNYCITEIGQNT